MFNALNLIRGGRQANTEFISERQVGFWVDNTRAKLIRQDLNKGRTLNPDLVQSLGCVDVEIVDGSECGCVETGCKVVRTALQIPATIETSYKNLITRIGPVQGNQRPWSIIQYAAIPFTGNNPFTANTIKAAIHNRYVYVIGPNVELMTKINIQGVFENPEEVANFITCDGDACYTNDSPYPIANWMIEDMTKMILDTDFRVAATAPTDKSADGSHDVQSINEPNA